MTNQTSDNNKRIAKNTIMLYLRMFFTMVVGLYTSRVVLQTLGVEDYGIYNVVGGVVTMLSFLNAAMSNSTSRYLTYEIGRKNISALNETFSTSFIIHLLIACIILFLCETIGLWFLCNKMVIPEDRMLAAHFIYQCSIISTIINITQVPYNAVLIAHEKMNVYAYVELLNVSLKLLIVYLLVIGPLDKLILYSLLSLLVSFVIACIYRLYGFNHYSECRIKFVFDKNIAKPMLGFTGWTLFGNMSYVCATQGLNIVLNTFGGPTVNAARAIAVQVQGMLNSFWTNFQTAVNPQIIKNYASKENEKLYNLVIQSSYFSFLLLALFSIPVFVEAPFLMGLWLTNVPDNTILFVRLALLVSLIECMSEPLVTAIKATAKIKKYQVLVSSILFLALPISYWLLTKGYPPYIVYVVNILISMITFVIRIVFAHITLSLPMILFLRNVVLKSLMFSIIMVLIVYACHIFFVPTTIIAHLLYCLYMFLVTLVIIFLMAFNNRQRIFFINLLKKRIKR